jgi:hypothetical protein
MQSLEMEGGNVVCPIRRTARNVSHEKKEEEKPKINVLRGKQETAPPIHFLQGTKHEELRGCFGLMMCSIRRSSPNLETQIRQLWGVSGNRQR